MATARRLEMTRISVIVPVHNAAAWLDDCLDALVSQDFPPQRDMLAVAGAQGWRTPYWDKYITQSHALGGEYPGR